VRNSHESEESGAYMKKFIRRKNSVRLKNHNPRSKVDEKGGGEVARKEKKT